MDRPLNRILAFRRREETVLKTDLDGRVKDTDTIQETIVLLQDLVRHHSHVASLLPEGPEKNTHIEFIYKINLLLGRNPASWSG